MFYAKFRQRMQGGLATAMLALGLVVSSGQGVVAASEPTVFALTATNQLLQFNEARPDRILSQTALSGLNNGEQMLGIDVRPANGQLYGVSNANQLYVIDTNSGAASKVGGAFAIPLNFSSEIGIDFNPVVDRLRLVTDSGQNLRVNPDTGAVVDADPNTPAIDPDGALAFVANDANAGKTSNVVAAAYTNNFAGTTATTLYNIDSDLDLLVIQNPPNAGGLNTVGALQVDASDVVGFDIFTDQDGNNARAAIRQGNNAQSQFYTIDLSSGKAKLKKKGTIGGGQIVRDIAIALNGQ